MADTPLRGASSSQDGSKRGESNSKARALPHSQAQTQDSSVTRSTSQIANEASLGQEYVQSESTVHTPEVSSFSNLSYTSTALPSQYIKELHLDEEDEEPATAISFQRSTSPTAVLQKNRGAGYQKVGEQGIRRMHRFSLYETASRYYLIGGDILDRKFRILKIDRTVEAGELNVVEDEIVYTRKEMNQLLNAVDDGNKASGGLKLRCSAWGLLGFIRFTGSYYMLLITKRSQVAVLGGHYIYQVDGTELIALNTTSTSRFKLDRDPEEARFVAILSNLDLSRFFYFSYSYDITRSLEHNIVQERRSLREGQQRSSHKHRNEMFVWNTHLLQPALKSLVNVYDWCIPIVHGFVNQKALSLHGRKIYITVIARRSRYFAGARFLKRGANDLGYVANDVETEQIVSEMRTTSFHAPGPDLYANPTYTSYVQHRGSIPLHWTQDSSGVTPKPAIELNLVDPFFSAAALHFDNLFERYGAPIYVLNLIKAKEHTPRESILLDEYTNAITYLNQSLPEAQKIIYKAWDMSRASKSDEQDVIGTLEAVAKDVIRKTGFFRNGNDEPETTSMQNGVARTNCIDCLDRTNAAQFIIGKCALGHQLQALGITNVDYIEFDTEAVNMLSDMYQGHGNSIAIQYGGSHLVNTMATYRKINQWSSHSRDMVESFKRYYHNSFLDRQRQEAYNLFLGHYTYVQGEPMLWDLPTDYYLHHGDPRAWSGKVRKHYVQWFTPKNLESRSVPARVQAPETVVDKPLEYFDDYWLEYYRPLAISSFLRIFSYKIDPNFKDGLPKTFHGGGPGQDHAEAKNAVAQHDASEKPSTKKGVTIVDPSIASSLQHANSNLEVKFKSPSPSLNILLQSEPSDHLRPQPRSPARARESGTSKPREVPQSIKKLSEDKSAVTQWTLDQFVSNSLDPSVVKSEVDEYQFYVDHPTNLPSVVSNELPPIPNRDLVCYVQSTSPEAVSNIHAKNEDVVEFLDYLDVSDDPLTVTVAESSKKRYKAYRRFHKGKPLFKQQGLDP